MRSFTTAFFLPLLIVLLLGSSAMSAVDPVAESLEKTILQFDKLEKDPVRGKRRDLWLNMEQSFQDLQKEAKGDVAAKAALY